MVIKNQNNGLLGYLYLAVLLFVFVGSSVYGQSGRVEQDGIIYGVSTLKVIEELKLDSPAENKIKQASSQFQKEIKQKRDEVVRLKKNLEKQASVLSESAFKEKQRELLSKSRDLEKMVREKQKELQKIKSREVNEIYKKIKKTVAKLAKAKKYRVVIDADSPSVLYLDSSRDITDDVIRAMKKGNK